MSFRTSGQKRRDVMREKMGLMRAQMDMLNLVNSEVLALEAGVEKCRKEHEANRIAYDRTRDNWYKASDAQRLKAAELIEIRSAVQALQLELLNLAIEELGDDE